VFLSQARYLVTKEEREAFLKLPPSERQDFKAEFWRKRDPTPETEENEFKDQYFQRIEEANQLSKSEGAGPGWIQDRGRIYILLGRLSNREIIPGE
jgi:GWxTD domain-containing protein